MLCLTSYSPYEKMPSESEGEYWCCPAKAEETVWQSAVAYISTIITFILLVGVIIYHVSLLVRKNRLPEEVNEYLLAPVQPKDKAEVTHSVIELPKPRDQSPPPQANSDKVEVKVLTATPGRPVLCISDSKQLVY